DDKQGSCRNAAITLLRCSLNQAFIGGTEMKSAMISGPLLDRIDLHIEVPAVEYRDIASTRIEEGSAAIRERVGRAQEQQRARFRSDKKVNCNARMGPRQIRQHCQLSAESQELIREAMTQLNLSARAYDRILKVSRTVADLQSSD